MGKFRQICRRAAGAMLAAVLTAGFFNLVPLSVSAVGGSCGSSATWDYTGDTLTISGTGAVTSVAWRTAQGSAKKVIIKDGITTLPAYSFNGFQVVEELTMADSVTSIGTNFCYGCIGLKTVHFSKNLKTIPGSAFYSCKSLKSLELPSSLETIGSSAFYGNLALTALTIPNSVKQINSAAFFGTNIKTLTLGSSLQTIGSKAFAQSCFPSVVIPDSVQTIGDGAIGLCYNSVKASGNSYVGVAAGSPGVTVLYGKSGSVAESYAKNAGLKFVATDAAAHEHVWSAWKDKTAATCEKAGEQIRTCSCGESETQTVPALGHSMSDWKVKTPATCTAAGVNIRTCSRCGKEETQTVAATGHSFGQPVYTWSDDHATCTAERTCANCGTAEKESAKSSYSVTKQAAVGVPGEGVYTAKFSNSAFSQQTVKVEIPAINSSWSTPEYKWSSDYKTCTATRREANSGKIENETVNAVYSVATAASCERKGKGVYTATFKNSAFAVQTKNVDIPATGHNWGAWTVDIPAGCETDGREKRTCANCGETELQLTDPTGHKWSDWKTDTAPLCDKPGKEVHTCSGCGEKEYRELSALGHSWGEWTVVRNATIDEPGLQESKCIRCGQKRTQEIPKLVSYVISVSANEGGTVSPDGNIRVAEGGSTRITFSAKNGYRVASVLLDGKSVSFDNGITVSDVRSNHTVSVVFQQLAPQVVRSCIAVSAAPKRTVWFKDEAAYDMNDFAVKAIISENGQTKEVDVTRDCYTNDTPAGASVVTFRYRGSDQDVRNYFNAHGIGCTVPVYLRGDCDLNGKVEIEDAMLALKNYVNDVAGITTPVLNDVQKTVTDVDGKDGATLNDATFILRYYTQTFAGLNPTWAEIMR